MNRRDFIRCGVGVTLSAGLMRNVLANSPENAKGPFVPTLDGALCGDDSPLFSLIRCHKVAISVGVGKPFKVLHVSDTHLNFMTVSDLLAAKVDDFELYEARRQTFDAVSAFAACILMARKGGMTLLHTGDVWDYHSRGNYGFTRDAFRTAGDSFYAIGNHEIVGHWQEPPGTDREALRALIEKYLPNETLFAARVINGVNFVSFDDNAVGKALTQKQFDGFKREFAKGLPVVVLCHCPLYSEEVYADISQGKGKFAGMRKWDEGAMSYLVYGTRDFEREVNDWVLAQPNLKAVLCGHMHHMCQYELGPNKVPMYCAGCAGLAQREITPENGRDVFEISFV